MAKRKTLEEIEEETLRGAIVRVTKDKYLAELEDNALTATDVRLILYVQQSLTEGYTTEYIRQSIGITGGHNDRKWKKILRDLKPAMLSDDYLLKYVGTNERLLRDLEARYATLKESFDLADNSRDQAMLSKAMTDIQKEIRAVSEGVLNTGKDLGQIGDGQQSVKRQPVVIINNIPRPVLGVTEAPLREQRGDVYVTEYTVDSESKK